MFELILQNTNSTTTIKPTEFHYSVHGLGLLWWWYLWYRVIYGTTTTTTIIYSKVIVKYILTYRHRYVDLHSWFFVKFEILSLKIQQYLSSNQNSTLVKIVENRNLYFIIKRTPTSTTTTSTTPPPPIGLCKLTLFSSTHFRGASKIFNSNAMTLDDFAAKVASLKIEGNCCWTLFTEENFGGDKQILNGPKDYGSPTQIRDVYKRAKSAKQHRC